jgi:ribosomal subunit interface protein
MQITVKATNMELTDAIRQYLDEKLVAIDKLVAEWDPAAMVEVEVGKSTRHHNKGPYMRCEMNLSFLGNVFRAEEEREDLYDAIDTCKDELRRQLVDHKDKLRGQRTQPRLDKQ